MSAQGDVVFEFGADASGLTAAGQAGVSSLNDLERAAKKSEQQLIQMGKAALEFKGQVGKLARENKELYERLRKAGEAAQASQSAFNKLTGVQRDTGKSARDSAAAFEAFEKSRAQVDNLRASIDPLYAASRRYESALKTLDTALEQGSISAREHAAMMDQLAAVYLRADAAADTAASGARGMGGNFQNIGFQIQDFATQVGAGTSATQAFAQQFPQLASAFGPVGVAVGTLAAVGVPLLAMAFADTGEKAITLQDAIDGLRTRADQLKGSQDILSMSVYELREKYGRYADEVRRATQELLALQIQQARNSLTESIGLAADEFDRFSNAVATLDATPVEDLDLIAGMLNDEFGLTNDQVYALGIALENVRNAANFEDRVQALKDLEATMEGVGVAAGQLPPVLVNVLAEMWSMVEAQAALNNELDRAAATAAGMTTGVGLRPDDPNLLPPASSSTSSSGGRRGGGGGRRVDPMQARLESLIESLKTEEEITAEWYASSLEALQAASDAELAVLGGKYAAIERLEQEHQDRLAGIRDAGNQWGVQAALEGGAAILGAMSATNKKAQKAQAIFAAASALMSTYQGAAKELEKGTFGFASAAAVIARGLGFVAAIRNAGNGGSGAPARSSGASAGASTPAATPAQAPVQTLNFTIQNDQFGIGERLVRQIASQLNEAGRNGAQLRAVVL